jgi:AAA family ATP:ADP antiporter
MGGEHWIWRLLALVQVRPGEASRSLLTFAYLFAIICAAVVGKVGRDTLFLSAFDAEQLPYAMVAIPVVVGGFVAVYARLARHRRPGLLAAATLWGFAGIAALFWWIARLELSWIYPVIYVWVGVLGVILPVQLWTLANDVFTTREAKRLFGFVGAGGILGAMAGGSLATALAQLWSTESLLLAMAVMFVLAAVLCPLLERRRLTRTRTGDQPRPSNLSRSLQIIGRSPHLRTLAALVFVSALATTMIDWQYKAVADATVTDEEGLAAFFGLVLGSTALIGFVFQLLLTSRLMKGLGSGLCLLALPLLLLAGSAGLLVSASLLMAAVIKASDGVLKHSLDRACKEMMYLPVASSIKVHAKSTIDMVVDRLGDGAASVLLLVVVSGLGLGLPATLLLNIGFLAVWLLLAWRARRHYASELRRASGQPWLREEVPAVDVSDPDTRGAVLAVLDQGTEAEKLGALELAAEESGLVPEARLARLVREESGPVATAALAILIGTGRAGLPPSLAEAIGDEGQEALITGIDAVLAEDPQTVRERLEQLVRSPGDGTRLAAMAFAMRRLGDDFQPFVSRLAETLGGPQAPPHVRRMLAETAGLLPAGPEVFRLLRELMRDPDPGIASAACDGAGRMGSLELIPGMIEGLAHPRVRAGARRGLRRLGASAVGELTSALLDDERPVAVRRRVPAVLADIGTSDAVAAMERAAALQPCEVRDAAIESLYRLRLRHPDRRLLPRSHVERELFREAERLSRLLDIHGGLARALLESGSGDAGAEAAFESVRDRLRRVCGRAFKLLALGFPPHDVARASQALASGLPERRANAIEFLDTLLPGALKRRLVPLLEESAVWLPAQGLPSRRDLRGPRRLPGLPESLSLMLEEPDQWLQACSLNLIRTRGVSGLDAQLRGMLASQHRAVREEAMLLARAEPGVAV